MNWTTAAKQEMAQTRYEGLESLVEKFAEQQDFFTITTAVVRSWITSEGSSLDWACTCGYVNPRAEQFCQACGWKQI